MHYQNEALFRLKLADGFLKEAEQDFNLERWRSCIDNSQLCSENAGKAIIGIFKPLEKTHDPSIQLKKLITEQLIDNTLSKDLDRMIPLYEKLGVEEHFLTDYGDEETLSTPWDIYTKDDADDALGVARQCIEVARKVYKFYFGDVVFPPQSGGIPPRREAQP